MSAQRELLAYKRVQYIEIQKAMNRLNVDYTTLEKIKEHGVGPTASSLEIARKGLDAIVTLRLIGSKDILDLLDSKKQSGALDSPFKNLVGPLHDLMRQDIEQLSRRLGRW